MIFKTLYLYLCSWKPQYKSLRNWLLSDAGNGAQQSLLLSTCGEKSTPWNSRRELMGLGRGTAREICTRQLGENMGSCYSEGIWGFGKSPAEQESRHNCCSRCGSAECVIERTCWEVLACIGFLKKSKGILDINIWHRAGMQSRL